MAREVSAVSLGERVLVEVLGQQYGSKVEAVDDRRILIAAPMTAEGLLSVAPGEVVRVFFARPDGLYFHEAEVSQQFTAPPRWLLTLSVGAYRIQRREFVRVEAFLEAHALWRPGDPWKTVYTRGISGGGVCLLLDQEPPIGVGDAFTLRLDIPDGSPPITTRAEVRRIEEIPEKSTWLVGCTFSNIQESDRQRIIRFVFYLEVEARRHNR